MCYTCNWSHEKANGKMEKLSDEIRLSMKSSGLRQSEMARKADIDTGQMSRFMSGKSMLSLHAVDRVAVILDLHIAGGGRPKKNRVKRK